MKRVRPTKKVLIKRIRPISDEYDFIFIDKDKVNHLLTSTIINPGSGTIYEKPRLFSRIEYKIKNIKRSKLFNQILLLIIGGLLTIFFQFIFENWLKK